ncbi:helix-turn-helix transcriptional regulator [Desulforhopalus sp. IMCC35007]|jgi:plasmid maintenance system antidote protein VapI|uniref:helix-turn-helix domain-containing protein n=1 Tax=Desulforhopalus sp. IMCC35007 TaxID=2569543 RepID=UPI0010AEE337|nr:helix-turn-helix transcriptional regulator [Desulforhopalus sp. IMCC35007]TKB08616.1 helix-turn-helix transcriptional regulator [Desulforhopalus sp. IMCC35007]
MTEYTSFSDLWADFEDDLEYLTEQNILEFTLQLHQFMEERDVSKKELADHIGSSQAYITKVFKGKANFTIASMTKLVNALGGKLTIHVTGQEEKNQKWFRRFDGNKDVKTRWRQKPIIENQFNEMLEHAGA